MKKHFCFSGWSLVAILAAILPALFISEGASKENSRETIQAAVERLQDRRQPTRDEAAAKIRDIVEREPAVAKDPGESYWREKLNSVRPGMTASVLKDVIGGNKEGGACSGQSCTIMWRLDDYWLVTLFFRSEGGLIETGNIERKARGFWVEPPKDFSGRWITYFVNGRVAHDIQYSNGRYLDFRAFHDNGQLAYEQISVNGQIDGPEIGYYPNGKKMYQGRHQLGKNTGVWTHWYPNGNKQAEEKYLGGQLVERKNWYENGKKSNETRYDRGQETGQASWDREGKLQFAHGSAADAKY